MHTRSRVRTGVAEAVREIDIDVELLARDSEIELYAAEAEDGGCLCLTRGARQHPK